MSEWPGTSGQGQPWQPPEQPFTYQDPAAAQPGAWPGGYQQPGPMQPGQMQPGPVQPAQQFQPAQPQPGTDPLLGGEPVMVAIGDISVTPTTVYTPSGSRPLSEVTWTFTDMSITSQAIPTWAIICAIVFFVFCLLGLLFLLAKENKTTGSVQVTVNGPGFLHTTTIPVASLAQVADINARVNYVRTLAASYPQPGTGGQPGIAGQPGIGGQPGIAGQPWQQSQPGHQDQQDQQDQQPGQPW